MSKRELNRRLKKLEAQTSSGDSVPVFIDILGDGMVEVYTETNGKKKRMTEAEYERWCKRVVNSNGKADVEVVIGEWNEQPAFIDDISHREEMK